MVISMQTKQGEQRKFGVRYVLDEKDPLGVLAIQRLLSEEQIRDLATALQSAVKYLDNQAK